MSTGTATEVEFSRKKVKPSKSAGVAASNARFSGPPEWRVIWTTCPSTCSAVRGMESAKWVDEYPDGSMTTFSYPLASTM